MIPLLATMVDLVGQRGLKIMFWLCRLCAKAMGKTVQKMINAWWRPSGNLT